ncbi:F-box/FBD/LRR-repeat protein At1g13570-like [Andrographis paniculata]|uniref:F-box/FBD/LRR-repeat protein At1g13570-like n=1 Tax=Andrographis paniculata TaxID=175694 RepID=UPI0021E82F95|nr:F-box/FBD/LRR-repeat protein At1g13570-like [Andrographis paniculata]
MDPDRISGLPGEVIDNILKYLPLADAVRTTVLSREWNYKWLTIPHIDLGWNFRQSLPSGFPRECVISHILCFHKGPIIKFSLRHNLDRGHVAVDRWLKILQSKLVEELSLLFNSVTQRTLYAVPKDLYSFHLLRHLELSSADINLPSTFKGFSALVKLTLTDVQITSENLREFISKCPMLEYLDLQGLTGFTTFWCHNVDAPRITYLRLERMDVKLPFTFSAFSLLAELRLWALRITLQDLERLLSGCPFLELVSITECFDQTSPCHLDINATNLKYLRLDSLPTFDGFSRLIKLELENFRITPEELRSAISKCPMLERLSIGSCLAPATFWCLDIDAPNLRSLNLTRTNIKLPPGFSGFSRLFHLYLDGLWIDPKELQLFISKCPMLRTLDVKNCNENVSWSLNIDAPNLRDVHLGGLFRSVCLKNTGYVEKFIVDNDRGGYGNFRSPGMIVDGSNMIKVFDQLPSLVKLEFGISFLQFLALGGPPQELPCKLNNLTMIELRYIDLAILDNVTCVVCLIRSSPILRSLEIIFDWKSERSFSDSVRAEQMCKVVEYLKGEQKQNTPCNNLKIVKIEGFTGTEPEVEFVKLLLSWGTELERLVLFSYTDAETQVPNMAIKELKRFYWESSSKPKFIIDKPMV